MIMKIQHYFPEVFIYFARLIEIGLTRGIKTEPTGFIMDLLQVVTHVLYT